jgi:hypothetical protein
MEGLQEWRLGGEIWRDMQNEGSFGSLTRFVFYIKPLNFGVEGPYGGLTGVALMQLSCVSNNHDLNIMLVLELLGMDALTPARCWSII